MTEAYIAIISVPEATLLFFLEFFTAVVYTGIYIHFCFSCVIV